MATDGWFYAPWYVSGWFPSIWFAPADEEHLTPEEKSSVFGGRFSKATRNRHLGKQSVADKPLTVEDVQRQWEILELLTRANTPQIHEISPPVAVADQNPVKNAGREAAMVSGPLNVAMPANYQGILASSPTDSAGEPLTPDQASAAIEAKRQRNNKALAMLLMEL